VSKPDFRLHRRTMAIPMNPPQAMPEPAWGTTQDESPGWRASRPALTPEQLTIPAQAGSMGRWARTLPHHACRLQRAEKPKRDERLEWCADQVGCLPRQPSPDWPSACCCHRPKARGYGSAPLVADARCSQLIPLRQSPIGETPGAARGTAAQAPPRVKPLTTADYPTPARTAQLIALRVDVHQ